MPFPFHSYYHWQLFNAQVLPIIFTPFNKVFDLSTWLSLNRTLFMIFCCSAALLPVCQQPRFKLVIFFSVFPRSLFHSKVASEFKSSCILFLFNSHIPVFSAVRVATCFCYILLLLICVFWEARKSMAFRSLSVDLSCDVTFYYGLHCEIRISEDRWCGFYTLYL